MMEIFKIITNFFWEIFGAWAKALGRQLLVAIAIAVLFFLIGRFG